MANVIRRAAGGLWAMPATYDPARVTVEDTRRDAAIVNPAVELTPLAEASEKLWDARIDAARAAAVAAWFEWANAARALEGRGPIDADDANAAWWADGQTDEGPADEAPRARYTRAETDAEWASDNWRDAIRLVDSRQPYAKDALAGAIGLLERARVLAADWGDDSHERVALAMLALAR